MPPGPRYPLRVHLRGRFAPSGRAMCRLRGRYGTRMRAGSPGRGAFSIAGAAVAWCAVGAVARIRCMANKSENPTRSRAGRPGCYPQRPGSRSTAAAHDLQAGGCSPQRPKQTDTGRDWFPTGRVYKRAEAAHVPPLLLGFSSMPRGPYYPRGRSVLVVAPSGLRDNRVLSGYERDTARIVHTFCYFLQIVAGDASAIGQDRNPKGAGIFYYHVIHDRMR